MHQAIDVLCVLSKEYELTSFVVSFVLPWNRVNIAAVTAMLVLHVAVIRHHVYRH